MTVEESILANSSAADGSTLETHLLNQQGGGSGLYAMLNSELTTDLDATITTLNLETETC